MSSFEAMPMASSRRAAVVVGLRVVLWGLFDSWICEGRLDGWKDRRIANVLNLEGYLMARRLKFSMGSLEGIFLVCVGG